MPSKDNTARASNMFGHFDILESIGQGGMGIVYRAHDTSLGREIALKVLKDDLRNSKHIAARFQREGEAFATLNHPNIVHIYSVGRIGRVPYIAMEYVEGDVLSRLMKRERKIPWEKALWIAEQVSEALACAHDNGIIHRDIKPGNILLDNDGNAFVTDFGIAKVLTAEVQLTVDGSRLGTPEYMSPERVQNQEVTASSDIYSLGIVLFQMITGQLPFKASTPIDLIRMIVTEPPRRIRDLIPEAPEDVERLVSYMLEKNPKDRPADAETLAQLLRRVREGKPLVEDDSGLSAAMEDFRDSMSTPTPYTDGEGMRGRGVVAWWRRMNRRVKRVIPPWAAPWVAGAAIAALAALGGYAISGQTQTARALYAVNAAPQRIGNWQQSPVVAEFSEETKGVSLAHVHLADFSNGSVVWDEDGRVLTHLIGVERTARAGQWAMVTIDPSSREGRLAVAPRQASVASVARGILPGLVLDGQERVARALKLAPYGSNVLVAMTAHPSRRFVAYTSAEQPGVTMVGPMEAHAAGWTPVAEPISLAGNGAQLLPTEDGLGCIAHVTLDDGSARIVSIATNDDGTLALEIVYEGAGRVISGGWDANSGQLLVAIPGPNGTGVSIVDTVTKQQTETGLSASAAAWGTGGSVALVRRDRAGQRQIYGAKGLSDLEPRQMTFLTAGVGEQVAASQDGRWIAATTPGDTNPMLVFVDMGGL